MYVSHVFSFLHIYTYTADLQAKQKIHKNTEHVLFDVGSKHMENARCKTTLMAFLFMSAKVCVCERSIVSFNAQYWLHYTVCVQYFRWTRYKKTSERHKKFTASNNDNGIRRIIFCLKLWMWIRLCQPAAVIRRKFRFNFSTISLYHCLMCIENETCVYARDIWWLFTFSLSFARAHSHCWQRFPKWNVRQVREKRPLAFAVQLLHKLLLVHRALHSA